LTQYGWFVHRWRLVWLQDGLPGIPGLLNRLRPTLPADDYDWGIHETVSDDYRWPRPDFRNADFGVFSGFDAGDYGSLDVAESALFHSRDLCRRSDGHTDYRPLEYVSFRGPDGRALRHQHGSGLGCEFGAWARRR